MGDDFDLVELLSDLDGLAGEAESAKDELEGVDLTGYSMVNHDDFVDEEGWFKLAEYAAWIDSGGRLRQLVKYLDNAYLSDKMSKLLVDGKILDETLGQYREPRMEDLIGDFPWVF